VEWTADWWSGLGQSTWQDVPFLSYEECCTAEFERQQVSVYVATLHTAHRINVQKLSCMHYQQFVDNFKEFLVICSADVTHVWDLIWPSTTPSLNAVMIFLHG